MNIEIESIKQSDIKEAHNFCVSIFEELGWDKDFAYGLDDLKKAFSKKGEVFLIAKQEQGIVGCGGVKRLSEKEGLLKRFYIKKELRGKGLASLMFERLKEFCKKQGYSHIVLDVAHNNHRAQRFYLKQGFVVFEPMIYDKWPESGHPEIFKFKKLDIR